MMTQPALTGLEPPEAELSPAAGQTIEPDVVTPAPPELIATEPEPEPMAAGRTTDQTADPATVATAEPEAAVAADTEPTIVAGSGHTVVAEPETAAPTMTAAQPETMAAGRTTDQATEPTTMAATEPETGTASETAAASEPSSAPASQPATALALEPETAGPEPEAAAPESDATAPEPGLVGTDVTRPTPAAVPATHTPPTWVRIATRPGGTAEHLAAAAVRELAPTARAWVTRTRVRYPEASADALARLATWEYARAARRQGLIAAPGVFGALASTAAQTRTAAELVLVIAAAYGRDPGSADRIADLVTLLHAPTLTGPRRTAVARTVTMLAGVALRRVAAAVVPGGALLVGQARGAREVSDVGARAAAHFRFGRSQPGDVPV